MSGSAQHRGSPSQETETAPSRSADSTTTRQEKEQNFFFSLCRLFWEVSSKRDKEGGHGSETAFVSRGSLNLLLLDIKRYVLTTAFLLLIVLIVTLQCVRFFFIMYQDFPVYVCV